MAKKKRIKIESTNASGEDAVVYLQLPDAKENKEAQLAYNKAFREALQSANDKNSQQVHGKFIL